MPALIAADWDKFYTGQNNVYIAPNTVIENFTGGASNDQITGNSSDNKLDGSGGWDVLVETGSKSTHSIVKSNGVVTISNSIDGADTVINVEEVQFADGPLFVLGDAEAQVARLYSAAFARAPDSAGLQVQINAGLHAGLTIQQLAQNFIQSSEFASRYGSSVSDAVYVDALYHNVLGRTPDSGGLAVQMDALAHGLARSSLLANFADSAENRAITAAWLI